MATLLDAEKGLWQLVNPFGDTPISSLVFKAKDTPFGNDNSDYSIALVQTSDAREVPEPATLGLLGMGLLGIGLAARRTRRSRTELLSN